MNEPFTITLKRVSSSSLRELLDAAETEDVAERGQKLDGLVDPVGPALVDALRENANAWPLRSVLRIVCLRYKCFAIVEEPYFDLEEWSSYAALYSRAFMPRERTCRRVHFFSGNERAAEALCQWLRRPTRQEHAKDWLEDHTIRYRGFMVLRAGHSFVVGRTGVEFDDRTTDLSAEVNQHALEKTGHPFCTAAVPISLHIGGIELEVRATPFVQQNPAIGMCGTASVWTASQVLAHRFGLHKFSYDAITRQAIYPTGHPSMVRSDWKFARGLTVQEIQEALACTGAASRVFAPGPKDGESSQARMRFIAYTFVESGLPVLMTYRSKNGGSHAVTIVGHLVPSGTAEAKDAAESRSTVIFQELGQSSPREHHLVGLASQLYYAHNDAYGPYDRVQIVSDEVADSAREDAAKLLKANPKASLAKIRDAQMLATAPCIVARGRDGQPNHALGALIVPLPPYVQNSPEPIMQDAMKSLDRLFPPNVVERVLWRCFLAFAPDFKQSIIARPYPEQIREAYTSLHLPLYIWVVEFTIVPQGEALPLGPNRLINGEFLYDSTTAYYDPFCLTQRMRGWFRNCRDDRATDVDCGQVPQIRCFVPTRTR